MAEETFDVVVIGAGPGGYVCAIRAAQLGLKTALVEKSRELGGTCLNIGCIPSKALLHASEMVHFARHGSAALGLKLEKISVDLSAMMQKKDQTVATLVGGVATLVKKRGVKTFHGTGRLLDASTVEVSGGEKKELLKTRHIVLATGSAPVELPFLPYDGKNVVHSTHALVFEKVPRTLAVVGGGAIGLELGSVWARLGSKVTVVEFLPRIAPTFDEDVSRFLERSLKKQGLSFELATKVTGLKKVRGKNILTAEREEKKLEIEADKILVAVGRVPYTEGLDLAAAGVELDERKRIKTGKDFKTTAPGVYAIGDAIPGPMLAHKAEEEGVAVAELIAGKAGHVNYEVIPNVIYTDPEVAAAGITEQDAKAQGLEIRTGKFPFTANGRALANDATEGFVKVIADAKTDRVLGVQIIGKGASELIAAAVTHMEYGGSAEDIARTVHAHPTISEALKEAALAVDKRAIHSL
jgi:dihydrolipoamide dehydrogenase